MQQQRGMQVLTADIGVVYNSNRPPQARQGSRDCHGNAAQNMVLHRADACTGELYYLDPITPCAE